MQLLRGVLIMWNDGSTTLGVIFPDDNLYVHEPFCDTWKSPIDFLTQFEGGCRIETIGPVVPTDIARTKLEEMYNATRTSLEASLHDTERDYNYAKNLYLTLDTSAAISDALTIVSTQEQAV